jgi:hypothetical protein
VQFLFQIATGLGLFQKENAPFKDSKKGVNVCGLWGGTDGGG